MRTSQVSSSTSRNPVSRRIVSIGGLTDNPILNDWSTASISLSSPRADRTILMICTRYDNGNNAIFNWTLDGVPGVRLFALAPSDNPTIDIVAFPNRSSTSGIITANGGVGSITDHYAISLYGLYGFGLGTVSQSAGSTDTSASSDFGNNLFSTGNNITISGSIRRTPTVLFCAVTSAFNTATQSVSVPGLPTGFSIFGSSGQSLTNTAGVSYSWRHGFYSATPYTDSSYAGSVTWSSTSRARGIAIVPIF